MVYIRMLHAPDYRSFLRKIYDYLELSIYVGRETVDIVSIDVDEIYDPTFTQGLTITGSATVARYIERLVRENPKKITRTAMMALITIIDDIGMTFIEEHTEPSAVLKPFVILQTTDNVVISVIDTLYKCARQIRIEQILKDMECFIESESTLISNSRIVVVMHEWRNLTDIYDEARELCKGREDQDICIEDMVDRIVAKEKPRVVGALYIVNGELIAKDKDVLKYAGDLLPEYESYHLRTMK